MEFYETRRGHWIPVGADEEEHDAPENWVWAGWSQNLHAITELDRRFSWRTQNGSCIGYEEIERRHFKAIMKALRKMFDEEMLEKFMPRICEEERLRETLR